MPATIISRIISSVQDNRVSLSNAQIARTIAIGSNWNTLRIGVRWVMGNIGISLTGTPRLAMGLCSGTTHLFGDATTTHFVGSLTNDATWNYYAGPPASYVGSAGDLRPTKRVGTTLTQGAKFGYSYRIYADLTAACRSIYFVDITKGSPDYSLRALINSNSSADMSLDNFLQAMQQNPPYTSGYLSNYNYSPAQNLAVSEADDGVLDSVNISWNLAAPTIEICDVAVARLA